MYLSGVRLEVFHNAQLDTFIFYPIWMQCPNLFWAAYHLPSLAPEEAIATKSGLSSDQLRGTANRST